MPYERQKTLLTGNVILIIRYFYICMSKKFVRNDIEDQKVSHFVTRISLIFEIALYHLA